MRLTKDYKKTYISNILQNIPKTSYKTQIHNLIKADAKAFAIKAFPFIKWKEMQKSSTCYFPGFWFTDVPPVKLNSYCLQYKISPSTKASVQRLLNELNTQQLIRNQLQKKLQFIVFNCNTSKQLDAIEKNIQELCNLHK